MNRKSIRRGLFPYFIIGLIMIGVLFFVNIMNTKINYLTYDQFVGNLENVTELTITPRVSGSVYELEGKMKDYEDNETFFLRAPLSEEVMSTLLSGEENYSYTISTKSDPSSSTFVSFLINVLPMIILLGVAFFIITRQMNSANKSMDFGKSRARLSEDSKKVTFDKVAGLKE